MMAKKIKIKGPIISNNSKWIYSWFGMEATCPKDIESVLDEAKGDDVEVDINSGGGDVYAGSEIFTLLNDYKGKTTGRILGIAASAAGVAAMGCKHLAMTPTGQFMIHNVKSGTWGDHRDMQHEANVLQNWNSSIANAYMIKTGKTQAELLDIMNQETWLNAKQALEGNFINEIMFNEAGHFTNSVESPIGSDGVIPQEIINKLMNSTLLRDSLPQGMTIENGQLVNSVQKGDDPMNLDEVLASLPEDQKQVIVNAIAVSKEEGKNEATNAFNVEKEKLENQLKEAKEANAPATVEDNSEETLLANADPKITAMVNAMKESTAKARADELLAKAELQKANDAKELAGFEAVASGFDKLPINAAEFAPIFMNFSKSDKEGFTKLTNLLTAVNNSTEQGKLFANNGQSGSVTAGTAWERIQAKVKEAMTADAKLDSGTALTNVIKSNPDLYEEYRAEQNGDSETEVE
jgi:ATP-dependent protease ClpP protease subunit